MSQNPLVVSILALLALAATAYFALIAARPGELASILMRRGYEQRGWTLSALTTRLRMLGVAGVIVSAAALGLAVVRLLR